MRSPSSWHEAFRDWSLRYFLLCELRVRSLGLRADPAFASQEAPEGCRPFPGVVAIVGGCDGATSLASIRSAVNPYATLARGTPGQPGPATGAEHIHRPLTPPAVLVAVIGPGQMPRPGCHAAVGHAPIVAAWAWHHSVWRNARSACLPRQPVSRAGGDAAPREVHDLVQPIGPRGPP